MDIKKVLFVLIIYVISASCSLEQKEIVGCYTAINFKNNVDTICIYKDYSYQRKIYSNDSLIYTQRNSWSVKNNIVEFEDFHQNFDVDLIKFPESILDYPGNKQILIETNLDRTYFCTGHRIDEYCYEKIK